MAGEHKQVKRAPLISNVVKEYVDHLIAEGKMLKTVNKYKYCFAPLQEIATRRHATRISQIDVARVDHYRAARAAGGETRKPSKPNTALSNNWLFFA